MEGIRVYFVLNVFHPNTLLKTRSGETGIDPGTSNMLSERSTT